MKNWGTEFMNKDIAEVLVTEEQIKTRVKELGEQISREYAGKDVILLCVLKGACVFFTDLARAMSIHLKMDFMSISSYGDAQKTSGIVRINKDMDSSITNKHVIIAEDIMDSGLTLSYLTRARAPGVRDHAGLLRVHHPQQVRGGLRPGLQGLLPESALCGRAEPPGVRRTINRQGTALRKENIH